MHSKLLSDPGDLQPTKNGYSLVVADLAPTRRSPFEGMIFFTSDSKDSYSYDPVSRPYILHITYIVYIGSEDGKSNGARKHCIFVGL